MFTLGLVVLLYALDLSIISNHAHYRETDLRKHYFWLELVVGALLTVLPLGPGAPAAPWGPEGPRGPGNPGAPATPAAPCRWQHRPTTQSHHAGLPVMSLCGYATIKIQLCFFSQEG